MSPTAVTKPVLPPLLTPRTASFPSEICSTPISAACMSAVLKQESDMRTPITPPPAYMDFLKALTPVGPNPPPSALSSLPCSNSQASKENTSSNTAAFTEYRSPTSLLPPTPVSATGTARKPAALRKLSIPTRHSPIYSPATATSATPRTAMSFSGLPSAIYSPFSPADWHLTRTFDATTPRSACSNHVIVKEVINRTVIYKRKTPNLDPAPKGKRRRTESIASSERSRGSSVSITTEDETRRMPPPPTIGFKESTPEKMLVKETATKAEQAVDRGETVIEDSTSIAPVIKTEVTT